MTRLVLAAAVAVIVAGLVKRRRRPVEVDVYAEPVPMTWPVQQSTGATFYYNAATGVIVSAN